MLKKWATTYEKMKMKLPVWITYLIICIYLNNLKKSYYHMSLFYGSLQSRRDGILEFPHKIQLSNHHNIAFLDFGNKS